MKITKVYTRTGDKGETSLVGGVRIKKSDVRLEAYGTVDELSAHLGMLVAMMQDGEERDLLVRGVDPGEDHDVGTLVVACLVEVVRVIALARVRTHDQDVVGLAVLRGDEHLLERG